jgi:alpha,alpha-trehalase
MVLNFAQLIQDYGHIQTATGLITCTRSPPYFALMVGLLAETKKKNRLSYSFTTTSTEYQYWMAVETDESEPIKGLQRVKFTSIRAICEMRVIS